MTPRRPPSMQCDTAYPFSGSNQHAYLTNKYNHIKKMRGQLPKVITKLPKVKTEHRKIYNFLDFYIRKTYIDPHRPLLYNLIQSTPILV